MLNTTSKTTISDHIKIQWIRLARSHNVSKNTFFKLLEVFGSPAAAISHIEKHQLKGKKEKPIELIPEKIAIKELEKSRDFGAEIIIFSQSEYPKLLKEIADPPPILTVKGNVNLLNRKIIAIVGPRNSSFNGCKFAKNIASDLGAEGFVISSGLARGIDTAAHLGSLVSGTIAIIAGGIDNIYPRENTNLYKEIAKNGLIVSETPFSMPPKGGNFPQRNRIISGISLGVVIVEATLRSGTLITARFAIEQNREVFAVPGSPFDSRCQGANRLIKQGAKLIENVADIINEFGMEIMREKDPKLMQNQNSSFSAFNNKNPDSKEIAEVRELILSRIGYDSISLDDLIINLKIPVRIFNIALLELELEERITNINGLVALKA